MFILSISCLTVSNFPWFMDLAFQVPIQCCSLQHQILLSSPDTSTTECYICFGPVNSFILGILVISHSSPVAYFTPSDLGDSSFGVISFCILYSSWGTHGKYTRVVCHSLLKCIIFCQNSLLWLIQLGWPCMAHSFIELCKPLHQDKAMILKGILPSTTGQLIFGWNLHLLDFLQECLDYYWPHLLPCKF